MSTPQSAAVPTKEIEEALELLDMLANFAYDQGFHECGYDPVKKLRAALTAQGTVEPSIAERELWNIINADRFNRDCFRDDTEFADWAQNRCRHTLAGLPTSPVSAIPPTIRVQLVGPTVAQSEAAWKSKIVHEGDVRLVWIVEADLWPMHGKYTVQEFKVPTADSSSDPISDAWAHFNRER